MRDEYDIVYALSNGDIADKLWWPKTIPFSTFCNDFHISVTGEAKHFKFGG